MKIDGVNITSAPSIQGGLSCETANYPITGQCPHDIMGRRSIIKSNCFRMLGTIFSLRTVLCLSVGKLLNASTSADSDNQLWAKGICQGRWYVMETIHTPSRFPQAYQQLKFLRTAVTLNYNKVSLHAYLERPRLRTTKFIQLSLSYPLALMLEWYCRHMHSSVRPSVRPSL